jgi:hypothetical protein
MCKNDLFDEVNVYEKRCTDNLKFLKKNSPLISKIKSELIIWARQMNKFVSDDKCWNDLNEKAEDFIQSLKNHAARVKSEL